MKAYNSLDRFRLESSFYTWLYRIAMNLSIDLIRKRKRRKQTSFDEAIASRDGDGTISEVHHGDSPRKAIERKQLYGRIMAALETLPEDQRQVVLLRELEGLSYRGAPTRTVAHDLCTVCFEPQNICALIRSRAWVAAVMYSSQLPGNSWISP